MRVLVIGATGFVGLNLVDAALGAGMQVRATRRRSSVTVYLRKRPVELCEASLDDLGSLVRAMEGCERVYYAAGHYPRYSTNLEQSVRTARTQASTVCTAALRAGVSRLIYTSSSGLLAARPGGGPADEACIPRQRPTDSVYRAVKWTIENTMDQARANGLDVVSLMPSGCLGPWDVRAGTGALLLGTIRGQMSWWVDGHVHVVDVGDVAAAHIRAADLNVPSGRYCLAGHRFRLGALLAQIVARYGGSIPTVELDPIEARVRADQEERIAQVRRQRVALPRELVDIIVADHPLSSARAQRWLGVRFRDLDDTLDRAHRWFTQSGYLPRRPAQRLRSPTRDTSRNATESPPNEEQHA